jgi:hypothetical protein
MREEVSCPLFGRCASCATHLGGLFLPQRDPKNKNQSNSLRSAQN